jgi:hypothetical protein
LSTTQSTLVLDKHPHFAFGNKPNTFTFTKINTNNEHLSRTAFKTVRKASLYKTHGCFKTQNSPPDIGSRRPIFAQLNQLKTRRQNVAS